ncbi:Hypothetical predicted protein [Pelobates cultripes]|uniref:Uncharacterized protein n=1 Tax=Pelobates cultripes TaxID=61616 RepID=A0AAD1T3D2_PELCU|nr:Hypothetical predicted protein [Pelobates cultripes]
MGRTRKQSDPTGTPRPSGREGEHSIRSYLQAATRARSPQREEEAASQELDSFPSTPARMSPVPSNMSESQLPQEGEWKAILPNLLTKADFEALSDRLGRVVREEVAQLRADLANMEARMSVAESETRSLRTDLEQTNLAVANQEADTANLTTWIDDLDNRGRRLNLRIRGMREEGPTEHVPDALLRLFTQVLGGQQLPRLCIVRAHRALRPPKRINIPRFIKVHLAGQKGPTPGNIRSTTGRNTVQMGLPIFPIGQTRPRSTGGKETRRPPRFPPSHGPPAASSSRLAGKIVSPTSARTTTTTQARPRSPKTPATTPQGLESGPGKARAGALMDCHSEKQDS